MIGKIATTGVAIAMSFALTAGAADARDPDAEHHHKQHPANHGAAVSAVAKTQGDMISDLAHSTTATGAARGEVISDAAQLHGAKVRAAAHAK